MIAQLTGKIVSQADQAVVIESGGIGFALAAPRASLLTLGKQVTLYTHLHWNQDQGPLLYGFNTEAEKEIFCLIISCSGVGPKIGLAVLEDITAQDFVQAVHGDNPKILSKVSGIGVKKAEHIIVQLKHKMQKLIEKNLSFEGSDQLYDWHTLSETLASLGYSKQEVAAALSHIKQDNSLDGTLAFDALLRHSLSFLAKNR